MKNKNIEQMVMPILGNMSNIFKDEEDKDFFDKIEITDGNLTDFFTASLFAIKILYEKITGDDRDLIDFIGTLNKLAVQYLISEESKPKQKKGEN